MFGLPKSISNFFQSRRFFTLWFGIGIPPFLIGTVVVAFGHNLLFGVITLVVTIAWLIETFVTTCRRCPYYGSARCGIPSLVTPLIFKKQSPLSISVGRVRLHYYADLCMIFFVNIVYWQMPAVFPVVLCCSLIGWLVVFRPKRFHGLLFRLAPAGGGPSRSRARGDQKLVQLGVKSRAKRTA